MIYLDVFFNSLVICSLILIPLFTYGLILFSIARSSTVNNNLFMFFLAFFFPVNIFLGYLYFRYNLAIDTSLYVLTLLILLYEILLFYSLYTSASENSKAIWFWLCLLSPLGIYFMFQSGFLFALSFVVITPLIYTIVEMFR